MLGTAEIVSNLYKRQFDPNSFPRRITTKKHQMGRPNRNGRNALRETMERLVPVAATTRGRHWCSQEARPKAWVRGHVQVSGDVRRKRRSRSGVCSFRNLGPQVPAEGSLLWPREVRRKAKAVVGCYRFCMLPRPASTSAPKRFSSPYLRIVQKIRSDRLGPSHGTCMNQPTGCRNAGCARLR